MPATPTSATTTPPTASPSPPSLSRPIPTPAPSTCPSPSPVRPPRPRRAAPRIRSAPSPLSTGPSCLVRPLLTISAPPLLYKGCSLLPFLLHQRHHWSSSSIKRWIGYNVQQLVFTISCLSFSGFAFILRLLVVEGHKKK